MKLAMHNISPHMAKAEAQLANIGSSVKTERMFEAARESAFTMRVSQS
tara:strand:- start:76436 stop:76579 length:144 start_codon:yes stop_codon:yes gene_type:complete